VPITLDATGNENALGFSVTFDPALFSLVGVGPGPDATAAMLITNDSQAAQGRVGVLVALNPGATWPAGARTLVLVTLRSADGPSPAATAIGFGDSPTAREVSDSGANVLAATFTGRAVVVKAIPVVTWAAPAAILYGSPLSATQLNATATVAGTFTYTPPLGTVLDPGDGQVLSVFFSPADSANFVGVTKTVVLNVTEWRSPPVVTQEPAPQTVAAGSTATFTATASGSPAPSVQWQARPQTVSPWVDVSGAISTTLSLIVAGADHGKQFRAVFRNVKGTAETGPALLTVRAVPFADDPLDAGQSVVRAVHITELRARIDALRSRSALQAFAWTDPTIIPGVTPCRAVHLSELRTALSQVYVALGRTVPSFTDASAAAGVTTIRATHILELRAAVIALE